MKFGTSTATLLSLPSSSFSPSGESIYSVFVPNKMDVGKNLQYLLRIPAILSFSRNSFDSSVI